MLIILVPTKIMSKTIGKQAMQSWLCPALTPVQGNCDFEVLTLQLEGIDQILKESSILALARDFALQGLSKDARPQDIRKRIEMSERNLRCEILRHKLGMPSFRHCAGRVKLDRLLKLIKV